MAYKAYKAYKYNFTCLRFLPFDADDLDGHDDDGVFRLRLRRWRRRLPLGPSVRRSVDIESKKHSVKRPGGQINNNSPVYWNFPKINSTSTK